MSEFPAVGEATVAEARGRYFLLVGIPESSAIVIAQGLAYEDFTKADLADGIESTARMLTIPGRIKRTLAAGSAAGDEQPA